jgi:hypothetical protein
MSDQEEARIAASRHFDDLYSRWLRASIRRKLMSTKRSAGGPRPWTKLRASFWLRPRRTRTEFGGNGKCSRTMSAPMRSRGAWDRPIVAALALVKADIIRFGIGKQGA